MEKELQLPGKKQRMEEWAERVSDCRSSGLTVRKWCKQHEIHEKTYYYWQRRIWESIGEPESSRFVPIPVKATFSGHNMAVRIRINGAEAEILAGTDAATIEAVCRALRKWSDTIKMQRANTPKVIESKKDRMVCYAEIR